MKFRMIGALSAVAVSTVFAACSSGEQPGNEQGDSSVGFKLVTMEGVEITEVAYDLNTQAGTDVIAGTIPVPNDGSVIDGFLGALGPADYALSISATGTYQGEAVSCVSSPDPTNFTLAPSQALTLPAINLVCTIENIIGDQTGSVSFGVNVTVEQIDIVQQVVETFSVTPITAVGIPDGTSGACTYPPMNIKVQNSDVAISYSWTADPDGTFSFGSSANTSGTYTCGSNGTKTLTVNATLGQVTASKEVLVTCTGDCIELCGNGTVDAGEECDDNTARCQNCVVVPVCGDGITDPPEQCDDAGPSDTCTAECTIPAGNVCLDCINDETELGLGDFNQSSCEPSAGCVSVRDCVLDSGCFSGIPAECYCGVGADLNLCETDVNFQPTGPCATEIIATAGAGATGADILNRFYDPAYDLGLAMLLVSSTQQSMCVDECQL